MAHKIYFDIALLGTGFPRSIHLCAQSSSDPQKVLNAWVTYYQTGMQKPLKEALGEVSFSLMMDHRLNKIMVETDLFAQKLENRYGGIYTAAKTEHAQKGVFGGAVTSLKEKFDRSGMAFFLSFMLPKHDNVEEGLSKRQSHVFQMFKNARLYYTGTERDIPQEVCAPMQEFLCERVHPQFLKYYGPNMNGISYVDDPFVKEALEGYRAYQSKLPKSEQQNKPK